MHTTTSRVIGPLLVLVLVLSTALPAFGAPLDEKRAEAARIKAQIDELGTQVELAAEDYNEAKARYDAVNAELRETEARLEELAVRQTELEGNLATRVTGMYRQGPLGALEVLLGSASFEEFAATWDLLQDMNGNDAARVADLKKTRAEIQVLTRTLATQQAEARVQFDTMKARKAAIDQQLAERKRILASVESDIAEIIEAQEQEARARAAAAAAAATRVYSTPTNLPRSEVVRIALSKLGAPYVWGAAGPDSFDCSGLTMWAYAQVGVSLPHSSRAQYSCGQRVSKADLAPGDLVFFGLARIHHVGMYIGGGNYVHAPTTGDVVKISSLAARTDYVGACRP